MSSKEGQHHGPSYGLLITVWAVLVLLTMISVYSSGLPFGRLGVLIAILITPLKAWLVLYYFMHLKYEPDIFKIIFIITVVTIAVFMGLTFTDVYYR
jgi:cytochrome c oxidase subunit IV